MVIMYLGVRFVMQKFWLPNEKKQYLTWPSRANKSFPYHVRTNHVGIASSVDDGADYPRHTYEPTLADQNTIIPLSRRTEELLTNAYGGYLIERMNENTVRTVPSHLSPRRDYPRGGSLFKATTTTSPTITASASRDSGVSMHGPGGGLAARDRNDNNDEDEDSGHPSLETSTSISPNDTAPPSAEESPTAARLSEHRTTSATATGGMMFNGTSRPNPFVVNGVQRVPNKIILEPIERSLTEQQQQQQRTTPVSSAGSAGAVPRHLFAAKNPSNA